MSDRLKELELQLVQLMLYYHHECRAMGIHDGKQKLATELPKWLHLSQAQYDFVEQQVDLNYYQEMIANIKILLEEMLKTHRLNLPDLKLSVQALEQLNLVFERSDENESRDSSIDRND